MSTTRTIIQQAIETRDSEEIVIEDLYGKYL